MGLKLMTWDIRFYLFFLSFLSNWKEKRKEPCSEHAEWSVYAEGPGPSVWIYTSQELVNISMMFTSSINTQLPEQTWEAPWHYGQVLTLQCYLTVITYWVASIYLIVRRLLHQMPAWMVCWIPLCLVFERYLQKSMSHVQAGLLVEANHLCH